MGSGRTGSDCACAHRRFEQPAGRLRAPIQTADQDGEPKPPPNIDGVRSELLKRLFIAHLHSDHTVGYPDLLAAWRKYMDVRINNVVVHEITPGVIYKEDNITIEAVTVNARGVCALLIAVSNSNRELSSAALDWQVRRESLRSDSTARRN
jgi:ribonuclease BN (tRNA processing enzyme)